MKTNKNLILKITLILSLIGITAIAFGAPIDPECMYKPWLPKCILM